MPHNSILYRTKRCEDILGVIEVLVRRCLYSIDHLQESESASESASESVSESASELRKRRESSIGVCVREHMHITAHTRGSRSSKTARGM